MYSRAADDDRALVGRNFDRALAAHDAEVREPLLVRIAVLEGQVERVERKCNTWALGSPAEQMMVVEFREALVTSAEPTEGVAS